MLMWTSASLVHGWRAGHSAERQGSPFAAGPEPAQALVSMPPAALAAVGSRTPSADTTDQRVGQVVAALHRESGGESATVSVRVQQAAGATRADAGVAPSPTAGGQRRVEGLGQGIRPAARSAGLSGAF